MFLRFEAELNGQKFSEIAPEIILRDIVESQAEMDVEKVRFANRYGQMVSSIVRTALSVRLVYVIRSRDIQRRMQIRDMVVAWASGGGMLTVNTRPGKMLRVICENTPMIDSSLKWAQDLSLTLTAYALPYWQDYAETTKRITSGALNNGKSSFNDVFVVGGHADARAAVTIYNAGTSAMTNLSILCDVSRIKLQGMSIPPEESVAIYYEPDGVLCIKNTVSSAIDGNSLMRYRTADSNDDLILKANQPAIIQVIADQQFTGIISARGVWL